MSAHGNPSPAEWRPARVRCSPVRKRRVVAADAAGVTFTADPVTGERGHVVITAARGLGERVVTGEAVGDEWVIAANGEPTCRRCDETAIDVIQAAALASLARRVEAHLGSPQDIEWAIASGELYLLQARPMTALPEPVEWRLPFAGYWMRNLRLGEWLPEPLTPCSRIGCSNDSRRACLTACTP
jgi:hypothetical protein